MKLDDFDAHILDTEGENPQEVLRKEYGWEYGENSAKKKITAIRQHIKHKQSLPDENGSSYKKESLKWNAEDGSRVLDKTFELTVDEFDNQTPELILKKLHLDPIQWQLTDYEIYYGSWTTTIKNNNKEGVPYPNYTCRCKAKVKPKQRIITSEHILEFLQKLSPPEISKIKYTKTGEVVELPMVDVHLGKLSLEDETGMEDNLALAIKLYKRTILDFLSEIEDRNIKVKEFWFPFGNDFFHIDGKDNATTLGTKVDTDGKWHTIWDQGTEAFIWSIEQLRHIAPVKVFYVFGNHDEDLGYCTLSCAEWFYTNCNDVEIERSKHPRKWKNYGVNTVLFTHMRYEKARILDTIRNEIPKDILAKSIFIEVHGADQHHEEVKDHEGIVVRRLPSTTTIDKWHNDRGYRAIRRAQAFVWNEKLGLRTILQSNVII
ncbi:MAG: hypothetical protein H8D23_11825 [Candidatus Brocadiales bacterium]|nr:hypothetical protein [Candidatus Brocadiales bacterium]